MDCVYIHPFPLRVLFIQGVCYVERLIPSSQALTRHAAYQIWQCITRAIIQPEHAGEVCLLVGMLVTEWLWLHILCYAIVLARTIDLSHLIVSIRSSCVHSHGTMTRKVELSGTVIMHPMHCHFITRVGLHSPRRVWWGVLQSPTHTPTPAVIGGYRYK